MSRALLGIDLDESTVGGLIEGLLAEDDLEKLADGGTEEDRDRDEREPSRPAETPPTETRTGDNAIGAETPSPGVEPTGIDDEGDDEEDGGLVGRLRSMLPKLAVAVAALGVLGFVAWQYGGRIVGAVKSRLGRGGDEDADDGDDADAPPARRRAKATEPEPEDASGRDEVRRPTEPDTDIGALVGLAALALIATVVRKFGEERTYDPLVDGPTSESGANGDDARDES